MNKKNKLAKNTFILSFGTLCTKGLMFFITPVLTNWLSREDYGIFDLLLTYISLIVPFITLDCGEAAFRFLLETEEDNSANDSKTIVSTSMFISLSGLIFSLVLLLVLGECNVLQKELLPIFIFLLVCEGYSTFVNFLLRGMKKLPIYSLTNIVFVVTMAMFSLIFVFWLEEGIKGILAAYACGYLVSSIYASIMIRIGRFLSIHSINISLAKQMLNFSLPLMPNAVSWWILNVSDRTIISSFLGVTENAIYAVANKMPGLCQTFFGVFHLSWQENAVETMNAEDRDVYYSDVMNKMVILMGSICNIVISCDFIYYRFLFAEEYHSGYFQVPILIVAIMFSMLAQFIGGIYIARKESKKNGLTTAATAIVNVIVHLLTISYWGIFAASISTFVAYLLLFLVRWLDIRRSIRLTFERKTILLAFVIMYFTFSTYLNIIWINVINVFFAIFCFAYFNYEMVIQLSRRILKK